MCTYNTPLPVGKSVFDVVAGGVDEHPTVLPAGTLQTHVLINSAEALQLPVADGQSWKRGTNTHISNTATKL